MFIFCFWKILKRTDRKSAETITSLSNLEHLHQLTFIDVFFLWRIFIFSMFSIIDSFSAGEEGSPVALFGQSSAAVRSE